MGSTKLARNLPVVLIASAIGIFLSGCGASSFSDGPAVVSEPRGQLTGEAAEAVLEEASGFMAASGLPLSEDAGCWFDRFPSEVLTVVCGPLQDSVGALAEPPGEPPYYVGYGLEGTDDGELFLRGASFSGVRSMHDHPVEVFRPDGHARTP